MKCRICKATTEQLFERKILGKYKVKYFYCNSCGLLQTEEPYWLEEAYKNSINKTDTGLLKRNIKLSKKTTSLIYFFLKNKINFLDYGGGYGIFTRLMRDLGFNFYWFDPFTKNLFAKGFEYNGKKRISLITSFETFEHFKNPLEELKKMLDICSNILISTDVLPNPIPKPNDWYYYGFDHGQHISFYSLKTLKHLASKFSLNFYTNKINLHLFTKMSISKLNFYLITKLSNIFPYPIIKHSNRSHTLSDSKKLNKDNFRL